LIFDDLPIIMSDIEMKDSLKVIFWNNKFTKEEYNENIDLDEEMLFEFCIYLAFIK
jgi:hypothetical protein